MPLTYSLECAQPMIGLFQAIPHRLAHAWLVLQTPCALSQPMAQPSAHVPHRLVRKPAVLSVVAMEKRTRMLVKWKSNLATATRLSLSCMTGRAKVSRNYFLITAPPLAKFLLWILSIVQFSNFLRGCTYLFDTLTIERMNSFLALMSSEFLSLYAHSPGERLFPVLWRSSNMIECNWIQASSAKFEEELVEFDEFNHERD